MSVENWDAPPGVPTVACSLVLTTGDKQVRLDCSCTPGAEYAAVNVLMNEMHDRIKQARNRELAGLDTSEVEQ